MKKYNKVMIVAHPDDEVLFGGNILEESNGWLVVCVTNGSNKIRSNSFKKISKLYNFEALILDIPDEKDALEKEFFKNKLIKLINPIINDKNIDKVVTHSPSGEYGHLAHIQLSNLVSDILIDKNKLYYFYFDIKGYVEISDIKKNAFDIYFPGYSDLTNWRRRDLSSFKNTLSTFLSRGILYLKKIKLFNRLINKIMSIINCEKNHIEFTDLIHCVYSQYYFTIEASNHVNNLCSKDELPRKNYKDVFYMNAELYQNYFDRKFMVTKYLPSLEGMTLSVGCHIYNQHDCYCLREPEKFRTIDIEKKWSKFGSPFGHETCDFLDYKPQTKFQNIILFGVMGIPSDVDGDPDNYSMYESDQKIVEKVDSLLTVGGTVLFGPDYRLDSTKKLKNKISFWEMFHRENDILRNKYILTEQFRSNSNIVIVCKKIK